MLLPRHLSPRLESPVHEEQAPPLFDAGDDPALPPASAAPPASIRELDDLRLQVMELAAQNKQLREAVPAPGLSLASEEDKVRAFKQHQLDAEIKLEMLRAENEQARHANRVAELEKEEALQSKKTQLTNPEETLEIRALLKPQDAKAVMNNFSMMEKTPGTAIVETFKARVEPALHRAMPKDPNLLQELGRTEAGEPKFLKNEDVTFDHIQKHLGLTVRESEIESTINGVVYKMSTSTIKEILEELARVRDFQGVKSIVKRACIVALYDWSSGTTAVAKAAKVLLVSTAFFALCTLKQVPQNEPKSLDDLFASIATPVRPDLADADIALKTTPSAVTTPSTDAQKLKDQKKTIIQFIHYWIR